MARRHAEKSATQRAAARSVGVRPVDASQVASPTAKSVPNQPQGLETRLLAMEKERDNLLSQVEALKARVAHLEAGQAAACDRIAWAIDAVQNVLDGKG